MTRAMHLRHLEEAERHIAQGERHIAEQEERIAKLARHGHNIVQAQRLLDNFHASQVLHVQHRDCILKELSGVPI